MRWCPILACLLVSCASNPNHPPPLDTIGGQPQPYGGKYVSDSGAPQGDGGAPTVLATGLSSPRGIAASGAFVYVTVRTGVLAIPKAGGVPQGFITTSDPPNAIVASATTACFTTDGGNVYCASLQGGSIATLALGVVGVSSIALANDLAYWPSAQGGASIERCGVGGAGRSVIASATGPFTPNGIAVAGSALYFTTSGAGANVYAVPTSGGVAEGLVPPVTAAWVDTVPDGPRVLVGHQAEGASDIFAISIKGGVPTAIAQGLPSIGHLARDSGHVYWTSPSDGSIYGMSLPSGGPVVIASGLSSPHAIAVDDAIYVTTTDGIVRASRLQ